MFGIYIDMNDFKSPEQYAHFRNLSCGDKFDSSGYKVPFNRFLPEEHSNQNFFEYFMQSRRPLMQASYGEKL